MPEGRARSMTPDAPCAVSPSARCCLRSPWRWRDGAVLEGERPGGTDPRDDRPARILSSRPSSCGEPRDRADRRRREQPPDRVPQRLVPGGRYLSKSVATTMPERPSFASGERLSSTGRRGRSSRTGWLQRPFVPRGTDERQFCSPELDLSMIALTRTPHGESPEPSGLGAHNRRGPSAQRVIGLATAPPGARSHPARRTLLQAPLETALTAGRIGRRFL